MAAGRSRRTGIILIVLILVVILIAVGALVILQGGGLGGITSIGQQPSTEPTPTVTPTINLITAARDIPRGTRLSVQDVTILTWPLLAGAEPPIGALVVSSQEGGPGLDQVEARIARTDILKGQVVQDFMLTPGTDPAGIADQGSDAALLIPGGQVAIAVPANRVGLVAYAICEGDHVDILASLRFIDVDQEFQTPLPNQGILVTDNASLAAMGLEGFTYPIGREEGGVFGTTLLVVPDLAASPQISRQTTQVALDNILVLRVGEWPTEDINQPIVVTAVPAAVPAEGAEATPVPGGEATPVPQAPPPDIVTLSMSPQEALVLKYLIEVGATIDIALRSALDDEINDRATDPVTLDYIINVEGFPVPQPLPYALDPRIDNLLAFTSEEAAP